MEDLFRFVILRSAKTVSESATISLKQSSAFQTKLDRAVFGEKAEVNVKRVAEQFIGTSDYVDSLQKLRLGFQMLALRKEIEKQNVDTLTELQALIKEIFAKTAKALVHSSEFEQDSRNL